MVADRCCVIADRYYRFADIRMIFVFYLLSLNVCWRY